MSQYSYALRRNSDVSPVCDLRSDTVTRPDQAMIRAMSEAELGDDVYGEDPMVNRLEATLAERLGKEAGLFLPTGTQSNLTALLAHCARGEEIIVGADFHVYSNEAAGASVLGGIALCPVPVQPDGTIAPDDVIAAKKEDDSHYPVSRLLSLENTFGGIAISPAGMRPTIRAGRDAGLALHLDGARFFNAVAEIGCSESDLAGPFDTVSVCLSKGLGAPAGSVLVGTADLIARARRWRKMLGGGMRQSGVLAAAGLYALDHNVARLAEDHARTCRLAGVLRDLQAGQVRSGTNMLFFTPEDTVNDALRDHLAGQGILIGGGASGAIRMVLHKDVDDGALQKAIEGIRSFFG